MVLSLLPALIRENLHWVVAAAIVLFGLVVYGFGDLARFSLKRVWAISRVAFRESIRRRILLITPLAILGVIIVSQLQRPLDEQDAIRQTIKFSLFAAGLVVTVTAIILACTNLPREIDNRVIYTIVTKPTTRLEIVVGKVIGFAKVSLAILLIMGLFTFVYLRSMAWDARRNIVQRLEAGAVDALSRPTYEYWARNGLLSARTFETSGDFQIYATEPDPDATTRRFFGNSEGEMIVPFHITPEDLTPAGIPGATPAAAGVGIQVRLGFVQSEYDPSQGVGSQSNLPIGVAAPTQSPTAGEGVAEAQIMLQVYDANYNQLIEPRQINQGQPITLTDPTGQKPTMILVPPDVAMNLTRSPLVYVSVLGTSSGVEYVVDVARHDDPLENPVALIVGGATQEQVKVIPPAADSAGQPVIPTLRGRSGLFGQQLRGGKPSRSPVAVYKFRDAEPAATDTVAFELRTAIERTGEELEETATRVQAIVYNRADNTASEPVYFFPENNRMTYFNLPASAMKGGNFDVMLRVLNDGHYISLHRQTMAMVRSTESFDVNLAKSLSILWMLSILVVIISIFCSTFLSWPIAIVLTVVILLGHWGVLQLGDATAPGIGNMVATDLGFQDPSKAKVVSASVEALSGLLNNLSKVLPDITRFSAIEDIERGVTISWRTLAAPLIVLLTFGVPMIVLSYVFLRNKEVAP